VYQINNKIFLQDIQKWYINYLICNKSNLHWSGRGLLGLRIPFEPHALALQSQCKVIKSFHLLATSYIFTNFTFTYKVCL